MTRSVPLVVLVGSTLAGVALGAVIGAELHIDIAVPPSAVTVVAPAAPIQAIPEVPTTPVRAERRESRRRRVTRRTIRVDRQAVLEPDLSMGRALLHRDPAGDFDGYRLSAIRRGSLADRYGFENGDVVHSIDGRPLTSMQEAMAAYGALSDRDQVTVELTRDGNPVELTFLLD